MHKTYYKPITNTLMIAVVGTLDMFFVLWPYATFPLSHIEEFFLPPLPYKREPKRQEYH